MRDILVRLLVTGVVMGVFDWFWLSIVANKFYKSQIGSLLLDKPNMAASVLFYAVYVVGVVVFVLSPALDAASWQHALGFGALFGIVAYATYDLTNLSTIKGFTVKLVIVDMLWGMVLTGLVSLISYNIVQAWIG
jgi:uncharacterized membrane protein